MQFSTIVKVADEYEVFAGATFDWLPPNRINRALICPPIEFDGYGHRKYPSEMVLVSNELLTSLDTLIKGEGWDTGLTIMKAAVRMRRPCPVLVPETEAQKCELQTRAQAVWIPRAYWARGTEEAPQVELVVETADLVRILMPGLALLMEDAVLNVQIVQRKLPTTIFSKETVNVLESFKVSFDGTNIKIDGVPTRTQSQECFV